MAKTSIERAMELGDRFTPAAARPDPLPSRPAMAPSAAYGAAPDRAASLKRSQEFTLDFARLEAQGYLAPTRRRSVLAEEVRLVKRRIMRRMHLPGPPPADGARPQNVLLVTSARPGEGKTFTATNLALSFVLDEGLNVLLIDADILRPRVAKVFELEPGPGLTDVLLEPETDLASVLIRAQGLPFSIMAHGRPVPSATDLFGGDTMARFVNDISRRYADRVIIFDAPPLLASTEPVVLAAHADLVLFVVEANRTSSEAVEAALELLPESVEVGFVLNRCPIRNPVARFGTYYGYGSDTRDTPGDEA